MQGDDGLLSEIQGTRNASRRTSFCSTAGPPSHALPADAGGAEEDWQLRALQGGIGELRGGVRQAANVAAAATNAASAGGRGVPPEVLERLEQMEAHVASMLQQLEDKDKQLARERKMLQRFRELEQQVEMQLRAVTQVRL